MADMTQDLTKISSLPLLSDTRPGVVFWRAFRDALPGALSWGVGYGVVIAAATLLYPLLDESNTIFTVLNGLGALQFLSVGRSIETLTSFPGYLALQTMSWGPLILAVYLIPQALRAIAQEERQGTLDILLSTPISRWRFLVEKTLAVMASLAVLLLIVWVSMLLSTATVADVQLDLRNTVASVWHLVPISLVMTSLTLLLSVMLRDSRRAGPVAAMIIIGSDFLRIMSDMVPNPVLDVLKPFSMFSYYRSVAALSEGFQWDYDVVLLVTAAVLFILALAAFQRRDLGV